MLNGRPVVFLSCSDRYKERVARKVRDALDQVDVWGVIVSDEPLLPRVSWEPGDQVEAYMNAADAMVALCTPDDTLSDGSVQTRPDIIDEIRMGRERPHLRDRVLVAKARPVRLPSNINPKSRYSPAAASVRHPRRPPLRSPRLILADLASAEPSPRTAAAPPAFHNQAQADVLST